ncbi:MAG: helix-turn-helix domain-containing protein [Ruminococcus sp.]|nr:helix-turn-helix domain-containing protein [Ruminococcus sp.]
MIDKELAAEMRRDGMTNREIAERLGCSPQYIQQILGNRVRSRKCTMDMELVAYKGIYDYMVANPRVTVPTIARIIHGHSATNKQVAHARRLIHGKNVLISKRGLDALIAKTGMTYEQLFELREGFAEEAD